MPPTRGSGNDEEAWTPARAGLSNRNDEGREVVAVKSGALVLAMAAASIAGAGDPPKSAAEADSWTLFRGSLEMTGRSRATLPSELALVWAIKLEDGFESTAAIDQGVVYLPSLDGRCYARSLADGDELWKFENPDLDSAKSSPCLTEDFVIYGDDAGVLRALRRKDGTLAWKVETQGEIICSPTYLGGKILFGSYDNTLYCVNANSGKEEWKLITDGPVHCSPSYVEGSVVVAGCDGFLHFVSIADGKETERLEIGGQIASTPAVIGDQLFFGTMNETVLGIDWKNRRILWSYRNPDRSFPFYSSPAVEGELVIIGGRDRILHGFDRRTGQERWTLPAKGRIDSSPVIVDGVVYVGSHDGTVYGVDAQTGRKVWEYVVGSTVAASPAVASGRLVMATADGTIACFGNAPE